MGFGMGDEHCRVGENEGGAKRSCIGLSSEKRSPPSAPFIQ